MPAEVVPSYELVLDAGPSAPWIVMVHGVSQDRRVFSAQVRDFSKAYRLMLIDLPGHGRSGALTGPYGLVEFASGIRAAVRNAGISRFHFLGTHIGAGAGLLLATRDPDLFASVLLEGPVFPGRRCLPSAKR
jgi:pimeloyl-ACP methyl ester carboxylesterase